MLLTYACAAKKMAVENADTLISHQMNRKLPLYSAQKDQLAKDVDQLLNSSKPTAQEIVPIIDEIDLQKSEKTESQYKVLESFFVKLSKDFTALISRYMSKLDSKQQKDFFATMDDENREILKKEKEKRLDQVEERFKMFLGSVNSQQKQIIREYGDYFQERAKERLDRRIKLHNEFKAIYKQDLSHSSRETMFQEAFIRYQQEALKGNKNLEMMKKFLPTLSNEQREHFRKELQEVKDLLRYYISIEY